MRLLAAIAIVMTFCSACMGPGLLGTSPAATVALATPEPSPTEKPTPTATLSTTSAPSKATPSPTPLCLATVTPPPTNQAARSLRVAYIDDGQLMLWHEETGQASVLMGGMKLQACFLSPDRELVAFTRMADAEYDEIWVAAMDGTGERRLATVGKQEARQRHPGMDLALYMGWVPNTHTLWYCRGYGGDFTMRYDAAVWVVDADGGVPRLLVPLGDTWAFAFSPTGRQLAVLGEHELRLVDVATGQVIHTVTFAPDELYREVVYYSPDGSQVLAYTRSGLAFVDATTGARRDVALSYRPLGVSNHSIFPVVRWRADGATALAVVFDVESYAGLSNPGATFTVWRLDLQRGVADKPQTFTGGVASHVEISPDGQRIAYSRYSGGNVWKLYLADLESGKTVLYGQGDLLHAYCWSADSLHFVFNGRYLPTYVGHLCAPPTLAGPSAAESLNNVPWVYAIEGRDAFLVVGSAPDGTRHIQIVSPDGTVRPVATRSSSGYASYVGHWLGE